MDYTLNVEVELHSESDWDDTNTMLREFSSINNLVELGSGTGFGVRDMQFLIPKTSRSRAWILARELREYAETDYPHLSLIAADIEPYEEEE